MTLQILLLIIGFVLLLKGADWLVGGASSLARHYKVSDLAVGLTIVAFGTSAPELVVNAFASIQDHQAIIFGNVIGSNIFNLLIILGIAGIITPLAVQSSTVWKEIPLSFFAIVLVFVLSNDLASREGHILGRLDGLLLLLFFGGFLFYVYRQLKTDRISKSLPQKGFSHWRVWGLIVVGLAGLVIGGRLVVTSAVQIAESLGMSEKIVGLTIVAAGTSLPELATSLIAAVKKNIDIAVGNIIGSNIFNLLFILGISSVIRPVGFDRTFNTELSLLALGTLFVFLAMFTGVKKKLDRWEAAILLAVYLGYAIYLVIV